MVVCGCPFVPGIACWRKISAFRVMGSESLNAVRNGFFHANSPSHALLFGTVAGSSEEIGTRTGNCRAPALYLSSGNGALYAAITPGSGLFLHPRLTMSPMSNSGTVWEKSRHRINASPAGMSPVGRKVLHAIIRENFSGCSPATRSPMSPPQSWHTRIISLRSSDAISPFIQSTCL